MILTTPISIDKSNNEIFSNSKIMTIGSCFSDHIGNKLSESHFQCLTNPYSTVFNPISLSNLLIRSIRKQVYSQNEIDQHNDRKFIYDLHSSYDSTNSSQTLEKANKSVESTHQYLLNTDFLIITFGTSIGYYHIEKNELVSNCHKVPNKLFERQFLDDTLMYNSISSAIDQILEIRPDLKIIFTVSPVRHTKEGLVDNNLSKSKLILLCHRLTDKFTQASYFPSYEIMIDELRDYRFYKEDMIHPSQQAVDIIWNRFIGSYLSTSAKEKVNAIRKLRMAYNHRAFNTESLEHKAFIKKQKVEIEKLAIKYPEVDFEKYRLHFIS